jgi:hypothetical protein
MSFTALFVGFTVIYVAMMFIVGKTLNLLSINPDIANTVSIGGAVLYLAALWACNSFTKANNRYFSKKEKTRVVLGMLVIDLVLQGVGSFTVPGANPGANGVTLFVAIVIGLYHGLGIYLAVRTTSGKKPLECRMNITESTVETNFEVKEHAIRLDLISSIEVKRMLINDIIGWPILFLTFLIAVDIAKKAQGWDNNYIWAIVWFLAGINFLFNSYQLVVSSEGKDHVLLERLSKSKALTEKSRLSEALVRTRGN